MLFRSFKDTPFPHTDTPVDSTTISNLKTLVTSQGFDKLDHDVAGLMLELLSARPQNVILVNAFVQLVGSPGALADKRTARKKVFDVDEHTP